MPYFVLSITALASSYDVLGTEAGTVGTRCTWKANESWGPVFEFFIQISSEFREWQSMKPSPESKRDSSPGTLYTITQRNAR